MVFYDYDEICYMTEVNFREIPPPRYPEDELASEPWYSVSPGDVFPEEFRHWLCADPRIGPLFEEMHADLLRADYWRALQMRIKTAMWKMSTPTGASSVLACAMAPTVDRIRRLRRHPAGAPICLMALRLSGLLKMPFWGIFYLTPPYASVTSFAALITSAPSSVTRSSVIREMGPEMEIAANGSRCSS